MSSPIRIFQCPDCRSLEILDDFDGPPEHDQQLIYLMQRHVTPTGALHPVNVMGPINIQRLDGTTSPATRDDWAKDEFREYLENQLSRAEKPGQALGLGMQFYAAKDTFKEDAHRCWVKKLKPQPGCSDYMDPSKRLVPDTAQERKELGLAKPQSNRSLCEFCVVHSWVVTEQRWKAGLYK